MSDWTRPIKAGEQVGPDHPLMSRTRGNILTGVAQRELGIGPPQDGKPGLSGLVREGIVKAWTAATWDNENDELTYGYCEVWPLKSSGTADVSGVTVPKKTIDRAADPIVVVHPYTHDVPEGANASWIIQAVVAGTCEAVSGWS